MIVISGSLTLTAIEEELGADLPLFGWHNIVTIDTISADSEDPLFPASNLANPATEQKWKSETDGEQYITVSVTQVDPIDYLAVAKHNFASEGIAVSVEGRADELDPWTELVAPVIPADDEPLLFRFTLQSLAQVRLRMTPSESPGPIPEAAVVYVGTLLIMERSFPVDADFTIITHSKHANATIGYSESGNFLGRIVLSQRAEAVAAFRYLRPEWYRENFSPFVVAAKEQPFFFVWAPESYPLEVGYCWTVEDPIPATDPVTGRVHVAVSMTGIA